MLRRTLMLRVLLMASLSPCATAATGPLPGAFLVTYFEIHPSAHEKAEALLREFAADNFKADGSAGIVVLVERGRPGRMAIVEAWGNKASMRARAAAQAAFRQAMQPLLIAPFDMRELSPLSVSSRSPASSGLGGAVYVVTQVDVLSPKKDLAIGLAKQLAEHSRNERGALQFDVLQEDNRPNHLTVVEIWANGAAHECHMVAAHTRHFRRNLQPLVGALYDERIYDPLNPMIGTNPVAGSPAC